MAVAILCLLQLVPLLCPESIQMSVPFPNLFSIQSHLQMYNFQKNYTFFLISGVCFFFSISEANGQKCGSSVRAQCRAACPHCLEEILAVVPPLYTFLIWPLLFLSRFFYYFSLTKIFNDMKSPVSLQTTLNFLLHLKHLEWSISSLKVYLVAIVAH